MMRLIRTGRGLSYTSLTPQQIADRRAASLPTMADRVLFADTFARVRMVAADVADLDVLWTLMGGRLMDPVMEAAAIESLASLRAEKRLP